MKLITKYTIDDIYFIKNEKDKLINWVYGNVDYIFSW